MRPDLRLEAIRATDVILAALQAAFSQDILFDNGNPMRFIRDDPKGSKVWVCDPESRLLERDGNRLMVQVSRGDYVPQELHLHNRIGGNFSDMIEESDLGTTSILIQCEGGNKTSSEVLASVVYGILKHFRCQIMQDYDIHSIRMMGISPPTLMKDIPGEPWITNVTLRLETQEHSLITEITNHLNTIDIASHVTANQNRVVLSLDSTPQ